MSDLPDSMTEFLGPMMGVGVGEITVIIFAVIMVLLVLMLFAVSRLKRILHQFADQSAAQNAALLEEFRMITLALDEEAKRSQSSANSPAKDDTQSPPATTIHPSLTR